MPKIKIDSSVEVVYINRQEICVKAIKSIYFEVLMKSMILVIVLNLFVD
jgi:hypothetical protein